MAMTPRTGAERAAHPPSPSTPAPVEVPPSTRRSILRRGTGLAAAGVVVAVGVAGAGSLLSRPGNDRQLVFTSVAEAMREVERLAAASAHTQALEPATAWSWAQTLEHCAQSIEFSLNGFPAPRSALFQNTVGLAAFQVFALRGRMSHNLAEPIPGAPVLSASAASASAMLARLRTAAQHFQDHTGPLHSHFAYGDLNKAQYEQAHAMHLANHLSAFDVRAG
ncbi:DUF1569 domain-containing protein [Acidovorax sp. LjRoot129]|uniref:DUF1569 domain-containing protein n=1 Tax=Acidovorax sp. LjRoot129 TaxID=3342260 RepID=UPI003ECCF691